MTSKKLNEPARPVEQETSARLQAENNPDQKGQELYQINTLSTNLEQLQEKIDELSLSNRRYRQLIESVQDIIYKASPEGYFTFVSPAVEKTLGYTEQELLGKHYTYLVTATHREQVLDFYLNMLESRQECSYLEFPVKTKNGCDLWIGQTVRIITGEHDKLELVAVARDISERKQIEDDFLTTQLRLTTLISNLQSAVLVEDEHRNTVVVNQLFCDLFDLKDAPQQLVGAYCSPALKSAAYLFENPTNFQRRIDELLSNQQIEVGEEVCMTSGRILERDYIPIFRGQQYMGHLWRYSDVTDKYIARERLRKSEEKYRGIMNNMELGLVEVDNNQIIVRAYERFCQMVGYTQEELIGQNAAQLFLTPEGREIVEAHQQRRKLGLASSYEVPLRTKSGQIIWILLSGAPILDEDGKVTGSIGIHYNLTERKQLEHELKTARHIAEEARLAEKQFLANMSHEIRTPLNAIIGMTHLMYDTRPTQAQLEYLDIIKSSADFLLSLICDLLDMAKIEAGRVEIRPEPFDLAGLLRSTQKIFQMRLQHRSISMDVMLDARITGNYVGDSLMLNQILLNLLGNAEKFTDEGTITLTARIQREETDCTWVEFQVSDTGTGIPADKLDRIFQKFRQVSPEGHKHKGTGLGLSITRELVEIQGGSISVRSQLGKGSVFTFCLPYANDTSDNQPKLPPQSADPANNVKNMHVLIVEDNLMNQKYIGALFAKWNIAFTLAGDGRQAVEAARKQKFDLILMDIQMPIMDGYEATIAIRSVQNPNQQVPIIALTASAMLDQKENAEKSGMNDFLTKPFSPEHLLALLQQYASAEPVPDSPKPIATPANLLDYKRLAELYGNDKEYAAIMFETFQEEVVPEFGAFNELIQQQRWTELGRLAHKLKPTLGLVGLSDLEAQLGRLQELSSLDPNPSSIQLCWQTFQANFSSREPMLPSAWQDYLKA